MVPPDNVIVTVGLYSSSFGCLASFLSFCFYILLLPDTLAILTSLKSTILFLRQFFPFPLLFLTSEKAFHVPLLPSKRANLVLYGSLPIPPWAKDLIQTLTWYNMEILSHIVP